MFLFIDSRLESAESASPSEAPRTIRQRSATCCGVPWAAIHSRILCRSAAESSRETAKTQVNMNAVRLSSYLLDTTLAIKAELTVASVDSIADIRAQRDSRG